VRALVFTGRITGHIVPSGKDCRLFRAFDQPTLEYVGAPRRNDRASGFEGPADTYCWNALTETLTMRDDSVRPNDREHASQEKPVKGRRAKRATPTASWEKPKRARADRPASLSATSHPADAEEAGLSDEEIALYRRRVEEGLYNSREVADEVARRMMKRGDI
jgi:hypothetical protein